jgi:cytochrome P450
VFTADPDGIRQIFTAPPEHFKVLMVPAQGMVIGRAFTGYSGPEHRRRRKVVAPALRGEAMRDLTGMMRQAALRHAEQWRPGQALNMIDEGMSIALDIIITTIFGAETDEQLTRFRHATRAFSEVLNDKAFLTLALFGQTSPMLPPIGRFRRLRDGLTGLIQEMIDERRARPADRPDILSGLMAARVDDEPMQDDEIRDNLITMLVAGHETTALSIAWATYWLLATPGVLDKVLAELDGLDVETDVEALMKLPYLDAVVKEVLRLNPPVPDVPRTIDEPLEVKGYTIPSGMQVAVSGALLHMDPSIFPEPEKFRPERFLERRYGAFEFIPFGGGDRICIGQHFSVYELKVILATLLPRVRLSLGFTGAPEVRRRGFLVGPLNGIPVVYGGLRS